MHSFLYGRDAIPAFFLINTYVFLVVKRSIY